MPETSRPTCPRSPWCALAPGHDGGCSVIRPITPPRINLEQLDKAVAGFLAGLRGVKTRTRTDYVLVPDPLPAVGGNSMHDLITDPSGQTDPTEPRVDVNAFIASQQKALGVADEYTGAAAQLGALVDQLKSLRSRTVRDPEDGELTSPRMLRSSLVKFDMGEQITRLERIQVAALGYAGAWGLLADEWHGALQEALAHEANQQREAAETALEHAAVDDQVARDAAQRHDHLTVPADRITDVVLHEDEGAPHDGE